MMSKGSRSAAVSGGSHDFANGGLCGTGPTGLPMYRAPHGKQRQPQRGGQWRQPRLCEWGALRNGLL